MHSYSELLRDAYKLAASLSDDPVTKNGAILVGANGEVIGQGVNRLPELVRALPHRLERPCKYDYMIHAEQDAVANAARQGHATEGATMFCPWAPCLACAQLLIQAGIKRLITHQAAHDRTPDRWQQSIDKAVEMLREANVAYERFDGRIGGVKSMLDGQEWTP